MSGLEDRKIIVSYCCGKPKVEFLGDISFKQAADLLSMPMNKVKAWYRTGVHEKIKQKKEEDERRAEAAGIKSTGIGESSASEPASTDRGPDAKDKPVSSKSRKAKS